MCFDAFLGEKHHLYSMGDTAETIRAIPLGINTERAKG